MKIYVITEGDYSDYHIVGVTLDRKAAEAYCRVARGDYYVPDVEEYETDLIDSIEGRKPYNVRMSKSGGVEVKELGSGWSYEEAVEHNAHHIGYFEDDNWTVDVLAKDEAHASKIGVDYIMQAKYMEQEQENEHID